MVETESELGDINFIASDRTSMLFEKPNSLRVQIVFEISAEKWITRV